MDEFINLKIMEIIIVLNAIGSSKVMAMEESYGFITFLLDEYTS